MVGGASFSALIHLKIAGLYRDVDRDFLERSDDNYFLTPKFGSVSLVKQRFIRVLLRRLDVVPVSYCASAFSSAAAAQETFL